MKQYLKSTSDCLFTIDNVLFIEKFELTKNKTSNVSNVNKNRCIRTKKTCNMSQPY